MPSLVPSGWAASMGRRTLVLCGLVVVGHVLMLVSLAVGGGGGEPHRVPVVISAPSVVSQSLAKQADAMPGEPFDASWTDSERDARAAVEDGTAVAAVLVDLTQTEDVVVVSAYADADLNKAVVDRLGSVSETWQRTLRVQPAPEGASDTGAAGRVRLLVLLCGLAGFGVVVAISLLRGPVAPTFGRGALRVAVLAGAAVGIAVVLQVLPVTRLPGNDLVVVVVAAGYLFTTGLLTLAVEALAGLVGLAVTAAAYFVLATPLLTGTSHYLLPPPWPALSPWTPTGAAQQALAAFAYYDAGNAVRPLLVVGGFGFLALVLLLAARAFRTPQTGAERDDLPVRHWRLRVAAVMLPLVALVGIAVLMVPDEVVAAPRLPSRATETACRDRQAPQDVAGINTLIEELQGGPALRGADVGADAELGDGRRLFVFGDTLRGPGFDGPEFVRNSMLLIAPDCVATVLPEGNGAVVADRGDGVGYWPMSIVAASNPGYDLVLLGMQRVQTTGSGSFDFEALGPAFAAFVVQKGQTPQYLGTEDFGPDDSDPSKPMWGAAMAGDGGWLYVYGTANPGQGVFGFSLQVARVRPVDVLDQSRWRYWNGADWVGDDSDVATLIPAEGGVSQTLSVFHRKDTWYALSKQDGDLGDEIVFWTASAPTGPFTLAGTVADLPAGSGGEVTYMPLAHPDIFPEPDSLVISYSRNNTDVDKVRDDPSLYRPRFLRVPLPD